MLGNWENKCSAFGRTKVLRKSPEGYQETQIKTKLLEYLLENQLKLYKCEPDETVHVAIIKLQNWQTYQWKAYS